MSMQKGLAGTLAAAVITAVPAAPAGDKMRTPKAGDDVITLAQARVKQAPCDAGCIDPDADRRSDAIKFARLVRGHQLKIAKENNGRQARVSLEHWKKVIGLYNQETLTPESGLTASKFQRAYKGDTISAIVVVTKDAGNQNNPLVRAAVNFAGQWNVDHYDSKDPNKSELIDYVFVVYPGAGSAAEKELRDVSGQPLKGINPSDAESIAIFHKGVYVAYLNDKPLKLRPIQQSVESSADPHDFIFTGADREFLTKWIVNTRQAYGEALKLNPHLNKKAGEVKVGDASSSDGKDGKSSAGSTVEFPTFGLAG